LFEDNLEAAITDTCINLDRQFLVSFLYLPLPPGTYFIPQEHCRSQDQPLYCGTTAVGALITDVGRRLTVFNIGDSEAILYRAGEVVSYPPVFASPSLSESLLTMLCALSVAVFAD
jgi:hypothetical protein